MSTASATARRGTTAAPGYRVYPVEVAARKRLGPNFVRITFGGDCLREFGFGGDDQRIKLMLPQPGRTVADVPAGDGWYAAWQAMPDETRPVMRTYTVRAYRPEAGELDVDFVLHGLDEGHGGPAARWASTVGRGRQVALLGPDRPGTGRMWGVEWAPPATARRLLLAGDETAVPAMAAIVESLPPYARGIVCVEVPTHGDRQSWRVPDGVEVRWSVRGDAEVPHGELLESAVRGALTELCGPGERAGTEPVDDVDIDGEGALLWEVPDAHAEQVDAAAGELYGWLAGEAGVIKRLRRLMVNDHGVPRHAVAFMGYWRNGRSQL
ncbi:siderophore-interacting protein [Marinitenerispora sediminis]|uniref:Siderophore-interacting protein n=1 Tax=Marinitenerispora sediminis TaxID=1931232 RepID=A0A368T264_9ACTN|nr:siderophore-interacting protein [Marinitenerispora sediminis]RCV49875.1 siderophore-interacting protein [Marinitenerispora sediminis]RCV51476.1 siderophore-interacting protein [Marinitenerispora sediminis]RCV55222.1 siderophore-interacting protein [Marinitenerispora sediminis]